MMYAMWSIFVVVAGAFIFVTGYLWWIDWRDERKQRQARLNRIAVRYRTMN